VLRMLLHPDGRAGALSSKRDTEFELAVGELQYALRAHGLRPDLVRPDGRGGWELFLHPADRVRHSPVRGTG